MIRTHRVPGPEWTGAEIRTLRQLYPVGGAKAVGRELRTRSIVAIYAAAGELGIRRAGSGGLRGRPGRQS